MNIAELNKEIKDIEARKKPLLEELNSLDALIKKHKDSIVSQCRHPEELILKETQIYENECNVRIPVYDTTTLTCTICGTSMQMYKLDVAGKTFNQLLCMKKR